MKHLKLRDYIKNEIGPFTLKSVFNVFFNPVFNSIILIRLSLCTRIKLVKKYFMRRLIVKYGIFLGNNTKIGLGLKIPHPNGIIFGEFSIIGENATIFQQVTIGLKNPMIDNDNMYPKIGNNCILGAGAKILGNINIGDYTIIGANSVVIADTVGGTYVGVPGKKKG